MTRAYLTNPWLTMRWTACSILSDASIAKSPSRLNARYAQQWRHALASSASGGALLPNVERGDRPPGRPAFQVHSGAVKVASRDVLQDISVDDFPKKWEREIIS